MDVRSIENVAPVVEHNGTVPVWWLVNPREMFDITAAPANAAREPVVLVQDFAAELAKRATEIRRP